MAEQVIQEIEDKIQNKKRLSPALPQDNVPVVNIRNVKMLSPPNYKLGEKVLGRLMLGSIYEFHISDKEEEKLFSGVRTVHLIRINALQSRIL